MINWNKKPLYVKCKRSCVSLRIRGMRIVLTPNQEKDVSQLGQPRDLREGSNILELLKKKLITVR